MLDRVSRDDTLPQKEGDVAFDPRDVVNFLWRQWKLITAATVLSLAFTAINLARQIPVYTATTQVLLDPRKEKAGGQDAILSDGVLDNAAIESQMAIIRSTVLMQRVAERERLANDPEFGGGRMDEGWSALGMVKGWLGQKPQEQPAVTAAADLALTVENLKGSVAVSRAGVAQLLNISFTSADPAKAARLANAVAEAFVVDKLDARFDAATTASTPAFPDPRITTRFVLQTSSERNAFACRSVPANPRTFSGIRGFQWWPLATTTSDASSDPPR